MYNFHHQRGAALAIGLILLVVATLLAVTAMRGTVTDERLAGNQRQLSDVFMAAETGVSETINWFNTGENYKDYPAGFWKNEAAALAAIGTGSTRGSVEWDIRKLEFIDDKVTIESRGFLTTTGTERVVRVDYRRPLLSGPAGAFLVGLLADKNIDLKGNAYLTGSAHANGNLELTGGSSEVRDQTDKDGNPVTSNLSAKGTVGFKGSFVGSGTSFSGANNVDVPPAGAHIDNVLDPNSVDHIAGVITSCDIPEGNLNGAVYFCSPLSGKGKDKEPNLTLSKTYSNGTIMVKGNVNFNGASSLGDPDDPVLDFAIIASGDITMNGASDAYGIWWADGDVTQNGASILGGAVVAFNNIRRNGVFNFEQVDKFSPSIPLPMDPDRPAAVNDWRELRE